MLDKELFADDQLKYNLYKRSRCERASRFEWDDPFMADGVPILARQKVTESDPNVKVAYNNFQVIQRTKAGYLASNIERTFADDITDDVKQKYKSFNNLNHFKSLLKKLMFSCAGWGNTYSLCYLDGQNRVRVKQINSWQGKVVYDSNNEPVEGYVYYKIDKKMHLFVYDKLDVNEYVITENGQIEQHLSSAPHGFYELPLIEWKNNDSKQGNAQHAVTLMDAYDRLMSDNTTEWATFRHAYLLLKNLGTIDEKTKAELQKSGVITGGDNAEAKFITKDINPEFVKFITQKTWSGIWIVSSSVDPEALASLSNATAFQVSQMYRSMEEDSTDTVAEWKISLEYLDRVLKSYWCGLDLKSVREFSTESVNYDFKRNIPKDIMTWLKDLLAAGGRLPQKEIFMKAGYDEAKAEELAKEAAEESYESLPDV